MIVLSLNGRTSSKTKGCLLRAFALYHKGKIGAEIEVEVPTNGEDC